MKFYISLLILSINLSSDTSTMQADTSSLLILAQTALAKEEISFSPPPSNKKRALELICLFCGKICTQKGHLTEHLRVHTKQKPHRCRNNPCELFFSHTSNRNNHERSRCPFKKS